MNPELEQLISQARAALARGAKPADIDARFNEMTQGRFPTFAAVLQAAGLDEAPKAQAKQLKREAKGLNQPALSQFLRMMTQGATMGFADELTGVGAAVVPGGKGYAEARDDSRARVNVLREEAPAASILSELGGGILSGGALKAPGNALVQGVLGGAAAGVGEADGGVMQRLRGGLIGGAAGGVIGGAFQAAGLARNAGGRVAHALRDQSIPDLVAKARPGETIMDIGGPRVRKLARAAESIPSEGSDQIRDALKSRSAQAPSRIVSELQRDTRLTFEDAVQTTEDLMNRQRTASKELYEAAYAVPPLRDKEVTALFQLPKFQQAYQRAQAIARLEGEELPDIFTYKHGMHGPVVSGVRDDAAMTIKAIDYVKRGMDDVIESGSRGGKMGRAEARALRARLKGMLERVDEVVPEYKAARAQYAGDAAVTAAFETGRKEFLRLDPRQIRANMANMSASERDFYRRGALDAVRARLEKAADGRDLSKVVFGNSETRKRMRLLFNNESDFKKFADAMLSERNMRETEQFVLGGSPTARIQAEQADLLGPKFKTSDVVHPINTTGKILDNVIANRLVAGGEKRVNAMAPLLTAQLNGGDLIKQLEEFARQEAARRAKLSTGARAAGVATGLFSGRGQE